MTRLGTCLLTKQANRKVLGSQYMHSLSKCIHTLNSGINTNYSKLVDWMLHAHHSWISPSRLHIVPALLPMFAVFLMASATAEHVVAVVPRVARLPLQKVLKASATCAAVLVNAAT